MPVSSAAAWRRRFGLSQPRLLLRVREDVLEVHYWLDAQAQCLGQWPWPMSPLELESHLPSRVACLPRYWLLPAEAAVRRPLELPAAARKRLDDLARFEVARQTPFTPEHALFQARVLQPGSANAPLKAELVVAPRRLWAQLDPAWQACLAGVDVEDGAGVLGVNLLPAPLRRMPADPLRAWPWLLSALGVLLLAGAALQGLDNRRQVLESLRQDVEASAPRAREEAARIQAVRGQAEGIMFLDGLRAATPPAVLLWGELTRRLPQGTSLERLNLQRGRMQLTGLSSDAASLVGGLQDSPYWRAPALDSVQRESPGGQLDRFVLSAQVGQEPGP
jgi:general secretion pathway protein L